MRLPSTASVRETATRLRERYGWVDHLVLTVRRYGERHGDYYAAAITYFSIFALVPLLMVAFAAAGYLLLDDEVLLAELEQRIVEAFAPSLGEIVNTVLLEAVRQRETVGVLGLVFAVVSGLAWMSRLREALSEQWGVRGAGPGYLRATLSDGAALVGLGLTLVVSLALSTVGSAFPGPVAQWAGLGDSGWARAVATGVTVVLSFAANWLVCLWVIARLPREPVAVRRAVRGALIGAVGLALVEQVGALYLPWVTSSPAGVLFGPVLGVLVASYVVARLFLFVTAWAATAPGG